MADAVLAVIKAGFIGIASTFGYVALVQHRKRTLLRKSGVPTSGVVVRLEEGNDPESNALYPVIRITTLKRETITVRYNFGTYPASFRVGQQVLLLYDPSNPQDFIIGAGPVDWDSLSFGAIGAAGLNYGLFELIKFLEAV